MCVIADAARAVAIGGVMGAYAMRFGSGWRDPARALVFAVGCCVLGVPLLIGVQWSIVAGPGPRAGAVGTIQSVYIDDPDQNSVEIATY